MVRGDREKIQTFMKEFGRKPTDLNKEYCNFVYVLKKGVKPEASIPKFSMISGMDLEFWQQYNLVGEVEDVATRICAKIEAVGGVGNVIFIPVDWSIEQLELLANQVRPRTEEALAQ